VKEITNLSSHSTAKEAMASFCQLNLRKKPKYCGQEWNSKGQLYCFYLFTSGGSSYRGDYGGNFAAYIKKHKLGYVTASPPVQNLAFHPEHANQAWLWSPDVKALEKWWDERKPAGEGSEGGKIVRDSVLGG
jgi:hypothetical protein